MIEALDYFRIHAQGNEDGTYTIDASMMERAINAIGGDVPSAFDLCVRQFAQISGYSLEDAQRLIRIMARSNVPSELLEKWA